MSGAIDFSAALNHSGKVEFVWRHPVLTYFAIHAAGIGLASLPFELLQNVGLVVLVANLLVGTAVVVLVCFERAGDPKPRKEGWWFVGGANARVDCSVLDPGLEVIDCLLREATLRGHLEPIETESL